MVRRSREVIMARSKTGEAIGPLGRTPAAVRKLKNFIADAERRSDLLEWQRGRAVLGYLDGHRVIELAKQLGKTRGALNRWLQWYDANGVDGLKTNRAPGPAPRLTADQLQELTRLIEDGPLAAGYETGVWTGPMIGDLIEDKFRVRYHNHHVPRLLHQLGFSVQRPRKRLARADREAQEYWLRTRFPEIKKKLPPAAA